MNVADCFGEVNAVLPAGPAAPSALVARYQRRKICGGEIPVAGLNRAMRIKDPLLEEQESVPDASNAQSETGPADGAAFGPSDATLYAQVAPELIRFASTLVGPSGADDLFATAVVNAMTSPRWPAVANQRAYLYRCVVNEAQKQRRSTDRRLAREVRVAERPDSELRTVGLDPSVLAALRRLTVRQRAVIYLTYWSDLTPKQVAETLESSLRTVERDLTTARTRLEEMLS